MIYIFVTGLCNSLRARLNIVCSLLPVQVHWFNLVYEYISIFEKFISLWILIHKLIGSSVFDLEQEITYLCLLRIGFT